jgi:hypothetical protein
MPEERPKNPIDAQREGLEKLERAPHHQTTEHETGPEAKEQPPVQPPGHKHTSGPLPNLKK